MEKHLATKQKKNSNRRFAKRVARIFVASLLSTATIGCSSKLMVQTEPAQADVFVSIEGREDRVKIGQTPFEISEPQLMEQLKLSPENTQWIELLFVKKDFQTRNVMIPSNRWGELSRTLRLEMKAMDDPTTLVTRLVKYLFNAKKFAETKQFEQAHSEIDKVLAVDSKMAQALNMKAGIYFLQGNMDEARAGYKRALEIDPGSNEAIQMLERIQNKSGAAR